MKPKRGRRAGPTRSGPGTAQLLTGAHGSPTAAPDAPVRLPLATLNRHGLIAGATGTGKTKTLQLMAEQLSAHGVPVFLADVKGDLSGLTVPGKDSPRVRDRASSVGQDWAPGAVPVELLRLGSTGVGVPVRATVTSFGPLLLSKPLGLNAVQSSSLSLVFHWADTAGLVLLDLADLRAVVQRLVSDEGKVTCWTSAACRGRPRASSCASSSRSRTPAPTSSSGNRSSTPWTWCGSPMTAAESSRASSWPASPSSPGSSRRSCCGCSPTC